MIVLMQVQTDYELIEEKHGQMLNYFNEKSPETIIYLCSLCPRVDTIVSDINEIIKYVLKRVSFGSKDCTKELKLECAYLLGQTS